MTWREYLEHLKRKRRERKESARQRDLSEWQRREHVGGRDRMERGGRTRERGSAYRGLIVAVLVSGALLSLPVIAQVAIESVYIFFTPTVSGDWDASGRQTLTTYMDEVGNRVQAREDAASTYRTIGTTACTDDAILRCDGTGAAAQGSGWSIDDSGNLTAPRSATDGDVLLLYESENEGNDAVNLTAPDALTTDQYLLDSVGHATIGAIVNVVFCGTLHADIGTVYLGPVMPWASQPAMGDATCDALSQSTVAAADEAVFTTVTAVAKGIYCRVGSALTGAGVFKLMDDAVDSSPLIQAVLNPSQVDGRDTDPQNAAGIAGGSVLAISAGMTGDEDAEDAWCVVTFALR